MPDGLSANYLRNSLAKYNLNGIEVGNFSALLESLQSLWLLNDVNNDWSD